jgi:hypothetical protein
MQSLNKLIAETRKSGDVEFAEDSSPQRLEGHKGMRWDEPGLSLRKAEV